MMFGMNLSGVEARVAELAARILGCLPIGIRRRIAPLSLPLIVQVRGTGALVLRHGNGSHAVGEIVAPDLPMPQPLQAVLSDPDTGVVLWVPDEWILRRALNLPAAAAEDLRQVLAFEMDRLTPFKVEQVVFDHRAEPTGDDQSSLRVELALVARHRVAPWLEYLQGNGIQPRSLSAAGLWSGANLLKGEPRPPTNWWRILRRTAPAVLLAGFGGAVLALPLWQHRKLAMEVQQEAAKLRRNAVEVAELRDAVEAEVERQATLLKLRKEKTLTVDVLRFLTRLLPDDTWLQQLEIKGDRVTLRGLSAQAGGLIKLLEDSAGFEDVRFLASVVQQGGQESFQLTARIRQAQQPTDNGSPIPAAASGGEAVTAGGATAGDPAGSPGAVPSQQAQSAAGKSGQNQQAAAAAGQPAAGAQPRPSLQAPPPAIVRTPVISNG